MSGIHDTGFHRLCWYQRDFEIDTKDDERVMIHFGAVDYSCRVWVNDQFVGTHEGGHTPFQFEITQSLRSGKKQILTVCVEDDPFDLAKPRGKQDWQLNPHSIWYPRTTGIWQTVWLEKVPSSYIDRIRWTPHLERWEIGCEVFVGGTRCDGLQLRVRLSANGQTLVNDTYEVISNEVHRRIALSDPGIDDFRNELLWSPEKPTLIQAEIQLFSGDKLIDSIDSYTALRSAAIQKDRFMLNGRPYYLRLVLDQGYWRESLMTPPDADAFRRDIELTKRMGFNGVRKHQKIEDPQFLYWADVMGLLVWEEMPSAYRFTHEAVERITREWTEAIDRDYNHPCVVVWVPFNESWGVPDLAEKPAHQNCVQALYHLTKTLDQTRPVIGNDGWESTATDIIGIHDYDNNPQRLLKRYNPEAEISDILGRRWPAGRMLTLEGYPHKGQPVMITEFGGIAFVTKPIGQDDKFAQSAAWGYALGRSKQDLQNRYRELLEAVNRIELFSGFCYTQLTDTFQEMNGLLDENRNPKFSIEEIASATRGLGLEKDGQIAMAINVDPGLTIPPQHERPGEQQIPPVAGHS